MPPAAAFHPACCECAVPPPAWQVVPVTTPQLLQARIVSRRLAACRWHPFAGSGPPSRGRPAGPSSALPKRSASDRIPGVQLQGLPEGLPCPLAVPLPLREIEPPVRTGARIGREPSLEPVQKVPPFLLALLKQHLP